MSGAFSKTKCPGRPDALKNSGGCEGQSHPEQKTTPFTTIKTKAIFKIHE